MSRTITLSTQTDVPHTSFGSVVEEWRKHTRFNLAAGGIRELAHAPRTNPPDTFTVPDDWPRFFILGNLEMPVPSPLQQADHWDEWVRSYPGWLVYGINDTPLAAHVFEDVAPPQALSGLSVEVGAGVSLHVLTRCTDITHLHLPSVSVSDGLEHLAHLLHLRNLRFRLDCGSQSIAVLSHLQSLTTLIVDVSRQLQSMDLQPLAALIQLEELGLRRMSMQQEYAPLAALANLRKLDLCHSSRLRDLTPLSSLISLTHLDISASSELFDLHPLEPLVNLQDLNLLVSPRLEQLAPLAHLQNLRSLNLSYCERVADLTPLGRLPHLRELSLADCWRVQPVVREAVEDQDFARFRALLQSANQPPQANHL